MDIYKELKRKNILHRNPSPPLNTIVDRPTHESTSTLNTYPQQIKAKSVTPCGHHGIGQELCHVCHQRAKRNVPIYLHEEKRHREMEEAKLLEQYQHNLEVDEHKKRDVN